MITVGLIKGRHEIPVSEYIWDSVENPMDFEALTDHAVNWVWNHCCPEIGYNGPSFNKMDYTDIQQYHGESLTIYVTGLTCALTAVLSVCVHYGVSVTLMHYDRETDTYREQCIF